jgi:hypothetical protein
MLGPAEVELWERGRTRFVLEGALLAALEFPDREVPEWGEEAHRLVWGAVERGKGRR